MQESVQAKPPINWPTTLMFVITTAITVVAVPWWGLTHGFSAAAWVCAFLVLCANEISITAGYHRLWAHRTYEAHPILRLFLLVFGTMAIQNSVLVWASGHRVHHRFVDDPDRDPYAATRGFWFSHIGWMVRYYPSGNIDFSGIRDLERDPMLAFQHRHYIPLVLLTNFGIAALIGWAIGDFMGGILLVGFLRLIVSHHFTFFINSLAHMFGKRPYTDENTARDNWWLAFLTFGEGYHNFHHIFAHDYRNGVRWWQWDPTKWFIAGLQFVGLTRKLKRTPDFQIKRAILTMEFKRAEERLQRMPSAAGLQIEQLRQRVAQEYDTFMATVAEWREIREQWFADKKRELAERWDQTAVQQRLKEIEHRLKEQTRRMRLLQAQLA